jgi:DNA-binding beta-propeller fold protein YncE
MVSASLVAVLAAGVISVPVQGAPVGVTTGSGSVWVLTGSARGERVLRLEPAIGRTVAAISIAGGGSELGGIAAGAGAIWAAASGRLARIDPGSDRVVATVRLGGFPSSLAVSGRDVWVTVIRQSGPGELVRVDARTNRIIARIRVGDGPVAVAVGLGSVWVANSSNSSVMRIDPGRDRVAATLLADRFSSDLVVVGDRVFVAGEPKPELVALNRLGQIVRRIPLPAPVVRIAARGHELWATDDCACAQGRLFHIDARNGHVLHSYPVGTTPVDLTVGPTAAWVANFNNSSLSRITRN